MKKRLVDLRREVPLLDIVSYGRAGPHALSVAQREQTAHTIGRTPEVMVQVKAGARTLRGANRLLDYIGREGDLGVETDTGDRADGKGFERALTEDWDLDLEAHPRQSHRSVRGRRLPKLVHHILFSMPPGTPPDKVLRAVRKLAVNEWQRKHRYAMALHTDTKAPHVHVVVKAMSEQGERLNIRKATLRDWRRRFAEHLRELGVAANATERAVRGETRTWKSDGIYRAGQRGESTHLQQRTQQVVSELSTGGLRPDDGKTRLVTTRTDVTAGWGGVAARLEIDGDRALAERARSFVQEMPPVRTERELLADRLRERRPSSRYAVPPERMR
jgi:hypothetical protein